MTDAKRKRKNPAAVALGRLGGLKGGPATARKLSPEQRKQNASLAAKARFATLSPEERSAIARKASAARWKKGRH